MSFSAEIFSERDFPLGVFWQQGKTDKDGNVEYAAAYSEAISLTPGGVPRVQDYYCRKISVLAVTTRSNNRIIFCPGAFNTVAKAEVDKVVEGASLDTYFSGSRLFVHELVHLWNDGRSPFAILKDLIIS